MINIPNIPNNEFRPVWIDEWFVFTGSSSAYTYYITDGTEKLFSGKAYSYPTTTTVRVNINRICENYLVNEMKNLNVTSPTGITTNEGAFKTFYLYDFNDRLLGIFKYYWNYNQSEVIYDGGISDPVNGHYAVNMKKLHTTIDDTNGVRTEWDSTVNPYWKYSTLACGDWCLYYLNRSGGWDSFLIEGKVEEKDDFSIKNYEAKASQTSYWSRENNRFRNEITHKWEVNTNWLSDEESSRLAYHLFSSNKVYLQNLNDLTIYPVDITDTSVTYKEFRNVRKLISYKIGLKSSNKEIIL